MRDRAADRAAAARLRMPDPRQRRGEQRLRLARAPAAPAVRPGARRRRRRCASPLTLDLLRAPATRMMSTRLRPRQAHVEHRHQRLPARDHARVAAVSAQRVERLVERLGADDNRTARASCAPPQAASSRAKKAAPSALSPPAWRASAAKNWPMMTPRRAVEQPAADRAPPCRRSRRRSRRQMVVPPSPSGVERDAARCRRRSRARP